MGVARWDVVVVGGGAMGAAAAWHLARRGRRVVVLERFPRGHSRGSSHGRARIFRLAHTQVADVRMAQAALPLWRELEEATGRALLTTTGGLDHGDPAVLDTIRSSLDRCGVRYESLTAPAANERWPGVRFDRQVVVQPDAGRLDADAAVSALHSAAQRAGADVHVEQPVTHLEVGSRHVTVTTAAGSHVAPTAVVACGAWTASVLAGHLDLPPLTVTRQQPAQFPVRDAGGDWPCFRHHLRRPDAAGVAAGAYGLASPGEGVKVGERGPGPVVNPDVVGTPDPLVLEQLRAYVSRWLPGLDPQPSSVTTCLITSTPSKNFLIDRCGHLVVGAGFSGYGFKFVPEVGRMLADLTDGPEAAVPARFRRANHAAGPPRDGR
ncbi:MAG TPA: FAD-dependent oxidoreductase [Nitriliruptorales bacterium]|nr:FAD-dependent oxidoreductase [Nitriliruptorales bacterium]